MSNYEIISKELISNAEVFEKISERVKDVVAVEEGEEVDTGLTYREEKVLEHLKKFNVLSTEDFEKAVSEVEALEIPRLEREKIVKIVELMPKSGTELRAIVSNAGVVLVDENVDRVLDVLKQF